MDASIGLGTEGGGSVTLDASVRRRRISESGVSGVGRRSIPRDAEEFDEFPLIVSPIRVPWCDPDFGKLGVCDLPMISLHLRTCACRFDPDFGSSECADGEPLQCNGRPLGAPPPLLDQWRRRTDGLGEAPARTPCGAPMACE